MVIAPRGRIDSSTASELEQRLLGHVEAGESRIIVDFSAIDYVSSAGLRVLLLVQKQLRPAKGSIVICGLNDHVRQVFEITGFVKIFPIYPSKDAVLRDDT